MIFTMSPKKEWDGWKVSVYVTPDKETKKMSV